MAEIVNASVQTLRHTFGAHHIAKGTELKIVQEVMGLKDTRSASIYQALAKEHVSRELLTDPSRSRCEKTDSVLAQALEATTTDLTKPETAEEYG